MTRSCLWRRFGLLGLFLLLVNVLTLGLGRQAIGVASDALAARRSQFTLTGPLVAGDLVALFTTPCFAVIGWRARPGH